MSEKNDIISNFTGIVYVLCPAYYKTGGTELAHQLTYTINKNGGVSRIVYYKYGSRPVKIHEAFYKYVDSFVDFDSILDSEKNIIVAPEVCIDKLKYFKKITKYVWWMSVDNFLGRNVFFCYKHSGFFSVVKGLLRRQLSFRMPKFDPQFKHLYQSEFAKKFIESYGATELYRLSDYLNEEYLHLDINTDRKDVVLYNPKKGLAFTQKLMKFAPDIQWVPLQNMTTEQVKETLLHSKMYIDFGNHPGKDRFPREAAMCGCCVITGKRGSAKYFEDVPIADEFKFDESHKTIPLIISKIRECLDNYEIESPKFNGYREFIKGEYQTFQDDVKSIFHLTKNSKNQD